MPSTILKTASVREGGRVGPLSRARGSRNQWEKENLEGGAKNGYFSATPDKGSAAGGAKVEVVFAFRPPPSDLAEGGLAVGQWMRAVAKVVLKGPGGDHTVNVRLEGYLQNVN